MSAIGATSQRGRSAHRASESIEGLDGWRLYNLKAQHLRGFTQQWMADQLAKASGLSVSKQHFSSWIRSDRKIPKAVVPHLARMLGVSPDEFPEYTRDVTPAILFLFPIMRVALRRARRQHQKYGALIENDELATFVERVEQVDPAMFVPLMEILNFVLKSDVTTAQSLAGYARTVALPVPEAESRLNAPAGSPEPDPEGSPAPVSPG